MANVLIAGNNGNDGADGSNPTGNGVAGGNGSAGQFETVALTKPDSTGDTLTVYGS